MKEQIPTFYVKYRFNAARAELINSATVPQGTATDTLSGARTNTGPNGETINRKDAYYSEYEAYLIDALYLKEAEIESKTEKGKKPQKMDAAELNFKSDFPDEEFKIMWTELSRETLEASATARGQRAKAKCGVLRNSSDRFLWNFPAGADSGRKFIRTMPIRRQIDREDRAPEDYSRLDRIPNKENAKKITGYELVFPKGMLMGAYFIAPSNLQAKLQLLKETDKNKNLFPDSGKARCQVTVQLARKFFLYFGVHKYAKTGGEEDPRPRPRTIEYKLEDLFREIRPSLLKKNGRLYSEHEAVILAEQLVRIYQAIVDDMPRCPVFEITDFKAQESRKELIPETGKTVSLPASLTLTYQHKEPPRKSPWKRKPGSRKPYGNKRRKKWPKKQ